MGYGLATCTPPAVGCPMTDNLGVSDILLRYSRLRHVFARVIRHFVSISRSAPREPGLGKNGFVEPCALPTHRSRMLPVGSG